MRNLHHCQLDSVLAVQQLALQVHRAVFAGQKWIPAAEDPLLLQLYQPQQSYHQNIQHTHTRLTAFVQDYLGETVTNLGFIEARDSEWQWYRLGHMQVCTSLQRDNHASNPPLSFLQAGCPS